MKMTDKVRRRNTLKQFGFGVDVMKSVTVCTNCNSPESAGRVFCSKCGNRLPRVSLYDFYKAQHRNCQRCGTVLAESMDYCPHCGVLVKQTDNYIKVREE